MSNKVNVDDGIWEENSVLNNISVHTAPKESSMQYVMSWGDILHCKVRNTPNPDQG